MESSYCHYLDMLKLQTCTNERNDVYIFFARRDILKLTCLTAKFQEGAIEPLREIVGEFMVYDEHSSFWSSEEMFGE